MMAYRPVSILSSFVPPLSLVITSRSSVSSSSGQVLISVAFSVVGMCAVLACVASFPSTALLLFLDLLFDCAFPLFGFAWCECVLLPCVFHAYALEQRVCCSTLFVL